MSKAGKINVLKEQNALKYGHVALSPSSHSWGLLLLNRRVPNGTMLGFKGLRKQVL